MTYDELAEIALALPDVIESMAYGAPCLKRGTRFMLGPKKDGETFSIKVDWDTHDRLLAAHPDVIFKTPHYEGYPAFLVRLAVLTEPLARELIQASWEDAPKPGKRA